MKFVDDFPCLKLRILFRPFVFLEWMLHVNSSVFNHLLDIAEMNQPSETAFEFVDVQFRVNVESTQRNAMLFSDAVTNHGVPNGLREWTGEAHGVASFSASIAAIPSP